ncbi:response regulator transcription factor [Clostridium sp. Sa3CUN1]|uniref:Response regulator transcription factor n=1 Tax=Clostridium gallinarum TaxID=2762246 RepID=A0ABR8Q7S5_9CLOT|nr:helix-turn-helix domain-containing protein [Clostridium gallinarum]MBD7916468.1 response regulator transcription factor [Clostridium gallinarum]
MGQALKVEKVEYIDKVHGNSKGWITRSCIDENGYSQWHYKYAELKETDLKGENIYITLNTFFKPYRRLECIKELNALFIDLDYYKTKFTKEQIIMNLEADYFNKIIPSTNYIIDSGRGLALIWLINKVPSKAIPLWKAIEEYLYNKLKEFGADRQALDATRILRVPGSINSKSKTVVSIIDEYEYIYDLREIQKEYLPELKPKEKKKGRPKKINYVYRERSLYYARIQDITKLCELRKYDLRGQREIILFLYRYYLCSFTEDVQKALEDVLELNSMFISPLKDNEVIRATRSAEKCYLDKNKDYKYKNETLIDLLEITEDEEKYMTTIISKNEYKRRDRVYQKNKYQRKLKLEGKISEKEKLSQRRAKIKDLLAEGLEQKDICLQLNISKRTYIRDRKYLKEQGLI